MIKIAIQTAVVPGQDMNEKYANAKQLGFDGVEISAWSFADGMLIHEEEIRSAANKHGIPTSSLCGDASGDFVHQEPNVRRERLKRTIDCVRMAERLGAAGLVSVPIRIGDSGGSGNAACIPDLTPLYTSKELAIKLTTVLVQEIARELEGCQASLFLEPLNRYEADVLVQVQDAVAICQEVPSPNIKVLCDTFHAGIEEVSPYESILAVPPRLLGHVHLGDSNRLLPGQGHRDFTPFFRALKEIEYDGYMALECGLQKESIAGKAMDQLRECLNFLRKTYAKA